MRAGDRSARSAAFKAGRTPSRRWSPVAQIVHKVTRERRLDGTIIDESKATQASSAYCRVRLHALEGGDIETVWRATNMIRRRLEKAGYHISDLRHLHASSKRPGLWLIVRTSTES